MEYRYGINVQIKFTNETDCMKILLFNISLTNYCGLDEAGMGSI
jgi:hypothetical protein